MKKQKIFKRQLLGLAVWVFILGVTPNCTPASVNHGSAAKPNLAAPSSPGEGYGGKVYLQLHAQGLCPDSSPVESKIVVDEKSNAYMLRENCSPLSIPSVVNVAISPDRLSLQYRGLSFLRETSPDNGLIMNALEPSVLIANPSTVINFSAKFNMVPLEQQGYKYCVHFLDAANSMVAYTSEWLPQTSDVINGPQELNFSYPLNSSLVTGDYKISAGVCRFNGATFDYAPMNPGTGVRQSPEGHAMYLIGTLRVN